MSQSTPNTIRYAMKFRIDPTEDQQTLIHQTCGCARYAFNAFLAAKTEHYEATALLLSPTSKARDAPTELEKEDQGFSQLQENQATHRQVPFGHPPHAEELPASSVSPAR